MNGDDEQPGLRLRVGREARRISSQHRQLDTFYGMVLDSLSNGRAERARSEFLRFHDALEAHFTVEEQIHFPALHGLRPELDAELATLVEVHSEKELDAALDAQAPVIGINNRDLDTFQVTLETTAKLRGIIPADRIVVSESGISSREDVVLLKNMKVDAALIGEELVKSDDPAARIRDLLGA